MTILESLMRAAFLKGFEFADDRQYGNDSADRAWQMHRDDLLRLADEPEARLTEMSIKAKAGEPMEAYAQFEGGAVKAFAVSLVQWFRESGGQNYVTCDLRDPETGEAYTITMQKAGGRTPAQDLCELRAQVNRTPPHE